MHERILKEEFTVKKIALFVAAIAVSLSVTGKAFAEGETASYKESAGITPDNAILYPIDKAIDNLKINIASGDESKAEALTDVALERLGESEVMADKEKTELSTEALKDYSNKINEAQEKVEDAVDKTSVDNEADKEKLAKLESLETKITEQQKKSIEVLKNLESKLPEKAKETISMVIEMQTAKKEAIVAVFNERKVLVENKQAVKDAEKKLAEAKKSGDEQAIKAAEDILKQKQEAYNVQKDKFKQLVAEKKEVMKSGVGKLKKAAKEDDKKNSSTETESQSKDSTTQTGQQQQGTSTTIPNSTTTTDTSSVSNATQTQSTSTVGKSNKSKIEIKEKDEDNDSQGKDEENDSKEKKGKDAKEHKSEKGNKGHGED